MQPLVTPRLATSSCNPACQERCNITGTFLRAAVQMRFCHGQLQTRMAGASRQIDQRSRSDDNEDSTAQIRGCSQNALAPSICL